MKAISVVKDVHEMRDTWGNLNLRIMLNKPLNVPAVYGNGVVYKSDSVVIIYRFGQWDVDMYGYALHSQEVDKALPKILTRKVLSAMQKIERRVKKK